MTTLYLNLEINPREICYFNAIIESYEGLGNLRTINAEKGLVQLWVMPDFQIEALAVVESVAQEIGLVKKEWGDQMYVG